MNEIFVDNFAGGGGASTGIEIAIGHSVDIAINHDPDAIAMHKANHPATKHYCEDVWQIDPVNACAGRPVALAWFSPDCTHFSRAKGGKPVDKNIRGLAWVAIKWALAVRPRVVMLENVPEIQTWGPLGKDNKPIKARSGETFKAFISVLGAGIGPADPGFAECLSALEIEPGSEKAKRLSDGLGYAVEYRELLSCDYGAPTKRKRFYMVARSDGKQIVWPEREYGDRHSEEVQNGELKPWHSAAECIDWSIPMKSIFDRKKPLADATCRRIARGIEKFVVNSADPFIVNYKFDNAPEDVDAPLSTVTAVNSHYVVAPSIVPVGYGERKGQAPRVNDINDPLSTVVSSAVKQNVVAPVLIQYHSEQNENETRAQEMREPIMTVDTSNRYGLVSAFIQKYYSASSGSPVSSVEEPLHTVTAKPRHYLTAANIMVMRHNMDGQSVDEPQRTVWVS